MQTNCSQRPSVSLALIGSGGAGVMTAGQMLLDAVAACGFFGLMTRSTGPQIRGGGAGHARALSNWLAQFPEPPENWDEDLDPPVPVD